MLLLTIPLRERPLHRLDPFHAENPLESTLQYNRCPQRILIMESFKMEYLFVVIALVSVGLVFAGLKTASETRKNNITRLEL